MSNSDELLTKAMKMLADEDYLFIGQNVRYDGAATYKHLSQVPMDQRIEFPVAEELQVGVSVGLSLMGYSSCSIFPRMDFLLRAMDQIVNHLDKIEAMSRGDFKPKVIIRTRVGMRTPLDAGPQHTQDHTGAFRMMLTNVDVYQIGIPEAILLTYRKALKLPRSSIIVEALG